MKTHFAFSSFCLVLFCNLINNFAFATEKGKYNFPLFNNSYYGTPKYAATKLGYLVKNGEISQPDKITENKQEDFLYLEFNIPAVYAFRETNQEDGADSAVGVFPIYVELSLDTKDSYDLKDLKVKVAALNYNYTRKNLEFFVKLTELFYQKQQLNFGHFFGTNLAEFEINSDIPFNRYLAFSIRANNNIRVAYHVPDNEKDVDHFDRPSMTQGLMVNFDGHLGLKINKEFLLAFVHNAEYYSGERGEGTGIDDEWFGVSRYSK